MPLLTILAACAAASCAPLALENGQRVEIGEVAYRVQAPKREGSIAKLDPETIRFTLEPGDQWPGDSRHGRPSERVEISSRERIAFGADTQARLRLRIPNQPWTIPGDGSWLVIAQLHGPNRNTLRPGRAFGPPPFAIEMVDGRLVFVARGGHARDGKETVNIIGSVPADPGQWHDYAIDIAMGLPGSIRIARDGEIVTDWSGPVGYDAGDRMHYWKFGLYRSSDWNGVSRADMRIACAGDC